MSLDCREQEQRIQPDWELPTLDAEEKRLSQKRASGSMRGKSCKALVESRVHTGEGRAGRSRVASPTLTVVCAHFLWASLVAQIAKNLPAMQET